MNTSTTRVAFLGTGTMGTPMARNLARAGLPTSVYNRTPDKAAALAGAPGIRVADSVADAARDAEVIVTMVKDADAVEALLTRPDISTAPGAVLLQMSTIGVDGTGRIAELAGRLGLRMVDAPVLGTKGPAEKAQLTVLASGPDDLHAVVSPLLDAIGRSTLWLSGQVGDASKLKVVVNALIAALTHGVAETVRLAEALDLDPRWVQQAITGGPLESPFVAMKLAATLHGNYEPSFTVDNAAKDSQLVLDAATATRLWAPVAEAGHARYLAASKAGHGAQDMAASYFADHDVTHSGDTHR